MSSNASTGECAPVRIVPGTAAGGYSAEAMPDQR